MTTLPDRNEVISYVNKHVVHNVTSYGNSWIVHIDVTTYANIRMIHIDIINYVNIAVVRINITGHVYVHCSLRYH